jgi:DnaK suppressor protein
MRQAEQNQYRERLLELRNRLHDETQEALNRVAARAQAADELSHVPTHAADRDSDGLDRDMALEANREQMLDAINSSLERIREGSYGKCEDCKAVIPKARLETLPFALRCVACEMKHERARGKTVAHATA